MKAVDTHCHLQMPHFDMDREEVLQDSLQKLEWIVIVGDGIEGCRETIRLIRPGVFATVGFHPYHAADYDDAAQDILSELAQTPGIVAIGETGLDYYNERAPRTVQQRCFMNQLALASRLNLPAVIHCRHAEEDTYALVSEFAPQLPACIMHCFGGPPVFAERCLELGCYLSFAGNVTFPKAVELQEAVRITPVDRILVETDAPYLAPQPVRGKRCEPRYVQHTLQFIAKLKGRTFETLTHQVVDNAYHAFKLR